VSIFGTLKHLVGSAAKWTVTLGNAVYHVAYDAENMIVSVGDEIWKSIPGDLLAPGLGPLAGLLKNEVEDELFMFAGPSGLIAGLGVFPVAVDQAAQQIIGGLALVHAIKHRRLNDEEWRMADWVFRGQLPPRNNIRLTNLGVPWQSWRAITFPAIANQYYINLGSDYFHKSSIRNGPKLLHELTHVWQGRNKKIRDLQIFVAAKDRDYKYSPGRQWRNYGLEQQAAIVEDWARGTIEFDPGKRVANPLSIASPLFRYIHTNLRTNTNDAVSVRGDSIRNLVAHDRASTTLRLSKINPPPPHRWW
jgi:hypothetical protein